MTTTCLCTWFCLPMWRIPPEKYRIKGEKSGRKSCCTTRFWSCIRHDFLMESFFSGHGAPLFYVSIWMTDKQQFYIPTMLSKLIKHLPQSWTVGCLYDIGPERSVTEEVGYNAWVEILVWSVSIFHTYGHQWACQLWYHPWKDLIWSLLDGDVCKQFLEWGVTFDTRA